MNIENIRAMNLKLGQHVEVRYEAENGSLDTRCGWFQNLFELPEGMTEIPADYKSSYPIEPPFVAVAHKLVGRNHLPEDIVQYKPEKIYWLRELKPTFEL